MLGLFFHILSSFNQIEYFVLVLNLKYIVEGSGPYLVFILPSWFLFTGLSYSMLFSSIIALMYYSSASVLPMIYLGKSFDNFPYVACGRDLDFESRTISPLFSLSINVYLSSPLLIHLIMNLSSMTINVNEMVMIYKPGRVFMI